MQMRPHTKVCMMHDGHVVKLKIGKSQSREMVKRTGPCTINKPLFRIKPPVYAAETTVL